MAVNVTSTISIDLSAISTNTDEQDLSARHQITEDETRTFGVLANQIDEVYTEKGRTLSVSTPVTLDLQSLIDTFGAALSFQTVYWFAIRNNSTVAGESLTIGNAAANIWEPFVSAGGTILIPAGDLFVWSAKAGAAVDATNKDLKIDPGAKTFAFDLFLSGTKS